MTKFQLKFYLASIYERRAELQGYMKQLEDVGQIVTSRWLKVDFDDSDWRNQAEVDLEDIEAADAVIVFTEEPGYKGRGGKDFEVGFALGVGKPIAVVGPVQHQFYSLFDIDPSFKAPFMRSEKFDGLIRALGVVEARLEDGTF